MRSLRILLLTLTLFAGIAMAQEPVPAVTSSCLLSAPDTDTELRSWFDWYNKKFFNNELPANTVVRFQDLTPFDYLGWTFPSPDPHVWIIAIDVRTNLAERQAQLTLLHEMAHVAVHTKFPRLKEEPHGKHWQREIDRLWKLRAFDQLI